MRFLLFLCVASFVCPSVRGVEATAMVSLAGSPAAIGTVWGRINAEHIREDMRKSYLEPAAEKGVSGQILLARGKRFVEISIEVAPHWLEEARAIAKAAGVDPDLYTAYIACVYRSLWAGDECTSYAVSRDYTKDNAVFFHKNRDNKEKPQAACVVASDVPGVNRFITVTDASVLACMMMVNEKGLAGSADTGGLGPGTPKYRGLMNTFVLRHIAERAASCADAEAIVRKFVKKGYYAGGNSTGTHWLFVDKEGNILEVSNNADEVISKRHTEKVYFSARADKNAASILRQARQPIDFHVFHNVSRDPSICFDTTICGMTAEISRTHPGNLTCAWFTLPAKGLAFPILMGCDRTPLPLMNGDIYRLSRDTDGAAEVWESIEKNARANKGLLEARAEALLDEGSVGQVPALLEDWVSKTTDAQLSILRFGHQSSQR